jgi:hypothetical protein
MSLVSGENGVLLLLLPAIALPGIAAVAAAPAMGGRTCAPHDRHRSGSHSRWAETQGQVRLWQPPGSQRHPVKALWQSLHEHAQNFSHMWPAAMHEQCRLSHRPRHWHGENLQPASVGGVRWVEVYNAGGVAARWVGGGVGGWVGGWVGRRAGEVGGGSTAGRR